jgi:inward rectifier potassium channel
MASASSTPATFSGPRATPGGVGSNPARNIVRLGTSPWGFGDLFHSILVMHWGRFLLLIVASQIFANAVFGVLFWLGGDDVLNAPHVVDKFYFSVQTWATIGYGGMTPTTTYANLVVAAESIASMLMTAVTTGLVFAKFARPQARILFAHKVVVTKRDGKQILMIRVANERGNDVVEASARVTILKEEISREGERMRRLIDLKLVRDVQPVFVISWTLMHEIDESSPFWGKNHDDIIKEGWRITANLTGHDGTLAQTIYASYFYNPGDVHYDARYVDVMSQLPDGRLQLDLTKFHDIEQAGAPAQKSLPIPTNLPAGPRDPR